MFNVTVDVRALERVSPYRFLFSAEVVYSNSITHRYTLDRCSIVRDRAGTAVVFGPSVRVNGKWTEVVNIPYDVRRDIGSAATTVINAQGGW